MPDSDIHMKTAEMVSSLFCTDHSFKVTIMSSPVSLWMSLWTEQKWWFWQYWSKRQIHPGMRLPIRYLKQAVLYKERWTRSGKKVISEELAPSKRQHGKYWNKPCCLYIICLLSDLWGITKDVSLPLPFLCEVTILFTINNVAKESNLILAFNRLLTNPESTYKSFFRDT